MVKLANNLLRIFPPRVSDTYEEMTYENTSPIIFHFILLCMDMVKNLKKELTDLKEVPRVVEG